MKTHWCIKSWTFLLILLLSIARFSKPLCHDIHYKDGNLQALSHEQHFWNTVFLIYIAVPFTRKWYTQNRTWCNDNDFVGKVQDSHSRDPMFKITGWFQGWLSKDFFVYRVYLRERINMPSVYPVYQIWSNQLMSYCLHHWLHKWEFGNLCLTNLGMSLWIIWETSENCCYPM